VAIDDHSRLAYAELLPDETKESAVGFLTRALAWCEGHGVSAVGVMTDNGSAYRSHAFRDALVDKAITHRRTRPLYAAHQRKGRALHPERPRFANGPMQSPSKARQNAPPPCPHGSAITIATDPTPPSMENPQSAD